MNNNQKQMAATIVKYFQSKGYTFEQSCAIAGNMYRESTFNIGAKNDNDVGKQSIGLCQWRADRNTKLRKFANDLGKPWTSLDVQLSYTMYELNNSEKSASNKLKTATTVEQASFYWCDKFERCAGHKDVNGDENTSRRKLSLEIYNGIKNGNWSAGNVEDFNGIYTSSDSDNSQPVQIDNSSIYSEYVETDLSDFDLEDSFADLSEYAKYADFDNNTDWDEQDSKDVTKNTCPDTSKPNDVADELKKVKSEGEIVYPPILNQEFKPSIEMSEHSWAFVPDRDNTETKPMSPQFNNDTTSDNDSGAATYENYSV